MKTYRIHNTMSGQDLGTYEAVDESDALNQMALDAGYNSFEHAQKVAPIADGELVVVPVPQ